VADLAPAAHQDSTRATVTDDNADALADNFTPATEKPELGADAALASGTHTTNGRIDDGEPVRPEGAQAEAALSSAVDGNGMGNHGGRATTTVAGAAAIPAYTRANGKGKVIDFAPSFSRIPSFEIYRPEASNELIRAPTLKMSNRDAVHCKSCPVNARPNAKPL
jgi:hypothetical protein